MRIVSPLRNRRDDEGGFVLVWMGLTLILLLGVAAFAVDLVHAYAVEQSAQNAADAAALAGAVDVPRDTGGCNSSAPHALAVASHNGFTSDSSTQVSASCATPNQ